MVGIIAFAMSRYSDSGYETPRMNRIIMARRLVRSQRKDMSSSEGNKALMTLGMESPTMTQKATMPPKALHHVSRGMPNITPYLQKPLCQRNSHEPRLAKAVLYRSLERVGPAELGVYDNQADGPVDNDGHANEEDGACDEAGVAKGIGLANDASASIPYVSPCFFPCLVALTLCCLPCS